MAGSFVENINLLAGKLPIIEESNEIFDEGVIPVLHEIAQLDLEEAIIDLKKGNYLGNRKLDINLILNMLDVDEKLLEQNPELAETIWTDVSKAVHYDRAFITFVDGEEIELPFMFDGSPVTVTTHGDLLAQLARLDYVYAKAQIDSIYQVTVGNSTDYTVTIDAIPYTFTSDAVATRENIVAGIANMINSASVPITALVTDNGTKINLVAEIPGNPFYATVSNNMAISTIQANVIEGPLETEFLAKLENTLAANFAEPVVGEIVRLYDVIGSNSNVERIKLNAVSGSYKTQAPIYYWAKTTSAFQTLSMRANDIIKLGNEIDNIILLAKSIEEVIEIQKRIPQLVDTYDVNGNPNGDETIYNNLSELMEVHSKLNEIITLYNDLKVGGTNYVQSIGQDLQGSNTIGIVASDLQLGVDSKVKRVGEHITDVITVSGSIDNVNTTAGSIANVNLVATEIVPNLPEILLADNNAIIATNKALEATNAAAIATAKSNEIKNVSVGSTITGAAGTSASVVYNPANGKFTFVVPQGVKGDRGEAFQVNALGLLVNRSIYDSMTQGFSFLAIDENKIYFKMSNTAGDWSLGAPFGKGDKGDKGDAGNGITQISFTGTTDPSGLAAQSGATDTYSIFYTNGSEDTFLVYNGLDSDVQSVAGRTGDVILTKDDVGLDNVDNTSDADKPLSNATLTALANKADKSYVDTVISNVAVINKPVITSPANFTTDYIGAVTSTYNTSTTYEGLQTRVIWECALDDNFNDIIDRYEGSDNLTSWTPSIGLPLTQVYIRTKQISDGHRSTFSDTVSFTTPDIFVQAPTISISGNILELESTPTISLSAFIVFNGSDEHISTDYQVVVKATGEVKWESLGNTVDKLEITTGQLDTQTEYAFRARQNGQTYGSSAWVEVIGTTKDVFFTTYGVNWNPTTDTYERTGDASAAPLSASYAGLIQTQMKRCVLNANGTVKYFLHPNDSTKKADGSTAIIDGTDGNVMVQIPKFWYKYEFADGKHKWLISDVEQPGFELHPAFDRGGTIRDFRYYPAYQGFTLSDKLISGSGRVPTANKTRAVFRTEAAANGTGWSQIDWNLLIAVQLLYLTEYADFDTQAMLGQGITSGSVYTAATGSSNSLGNVSSPSTNTNTQFMSYRGIENWYGQIFKFIDGVNIKEREYFVNKKPSTYADDVFTGDYVTTGMTMVAANGYVKNIVQSKNGFISSNAGGTDSTYIPDYQYQTTGNRIVCFGGSAGNGLAAGGFYVSGAAAASDTFTAFGSAVSY